jgi:hypothetical protein
MEDGRGGLEENRKNKMKEAIRVQKCKKHLKKREDLSKR